MWPEFKQEASVQIHDTFSLKKQQVVARKQLSGRSMYFFSMCEDLGPAPSTEEQTLYFSTLFNKRA